MKIPFFSKCAKKQRKSSDLNVNDQNNRDDLSILSTRSLGPNVLSIARSLNPDALITGIPFLQSRTACFDHSRASTDNSGSILFQDGNPVSGCASRDFMLQYDDIKSTCTPHDSTL